MDIERSSSDVRVLTVGLLGALPVLFLAVCLPWKSYIFREHDDVSARKLLYRVLTLV